MRLFFAFWPEDGDRQALAHATHKAVRASGGRPMAIENLHATLLFIGTVPADRVPDVAAAADGLVPPAFTIEFDAIEHWIKPQVLCVTASQTPEPARELATALMRNVARTGITPDVKPFRAHVTVARKVVKPHALGPIAPVRWQINGFALVESQTLPQGSRYTVVRRW